MITLSYRNRTLKKIKPSQIPNHYHRGKKVYAVNLNLTDLHLQVFQISELSWDRLERVHSYFCDKEAVCGILELQTIGGVFLRGQRVVTFYVEI